MVGMHSELPYREVVTAPPPASAVENARLKEELQEERKSHWQDMRERVVDNLKHHIAALAAALLIAVVIPFAIRWYRGRNTTTVTTTNTTSITAPTAAAAPSVAEVVEDPSKAAATAIVSALSSDSSEPSGTALAGKGRYQLYRQGKITWRLDTDSGEACILFATEAEWHKQRVYENGCNSQ